MSKQQHDKRARPGGSLPGERQDEGFREELPHAGANKIKIEAKKESAGDKAKEDNKEQKRS